MKKIDPTLLSFQATEENHYLITEKEAEMLSRGELTFRNGSLYRTEHLFPQKVEILELKQDVEQPLNLYGEDKQRSKLQELTIGNQEWVQTSHQPTLNKIRAGTNENLGPLNPTAEDLIPRPIDMDNLVVEDPVYLSLELEGMENSHIKELELILRGLHHNTGNDRVASFEQFAQHAGTLYGEYRSHVRMPDQDDFDPELTKWTIAIHLQDAYWESFRGRTITILKLFNKLYNPDDKFYYLETPIMGMKKR